MNNFTEKIRNVFKFDNFLYIAVSWLPKSIGVISRPKEERFQARSQKVHEYFYGSQGTLDPFNIEVKFEDIQDRLFQVEKVDRDFKLSKHLPDPKSLKNCVLALSFAKNANELTRSNIAGFVCVTEASTDTLTFLSPQPEPLPELLFLKTEITL